MSDGTKMQVDTALVRELAELLDATNLSEIEVRDGERQVRVARKGGGAAASYAPPPPPASVAAAPPPPPPGVVGDDWKTQPGLIRSPIVGTAYLTPEPGADPFVVEGARVTAGDTLLIIEAMKVMNPITAPRDGTVRRIIVGHEAPVEFDEPLIVIA